MTFREGWTRDTKFSEHGRELCNLNAKVSKALHLLMDLQSELADAIGNDLEQQHLKDLARESTAHAHDDSSPSSSEREFGTESKDSAAHAGVEGGDVPTSPSAGDVEQHFYFGDYVWIKDHDNKFHLGKIIERAKRA